VLKFKEAHLSRGLFGENATGEQYKKQNKEQLQPISNDHDGS